MQNLICKPNQCVIVRDIIPHMLSHIFECPVSKKSRSCFYPVVGSFSRRSYSMEQNGTEPPTAGIIVIGDEILKGQIQDTNGHFIAHRLKNLGVGVKKISVIGDDLATISAEIEHFSQLFTYVVTTGGIGPTHDDVTFQGVADAFNETLEPHPDLVAFIGDYFKTNDLSSPPMKMAIIPSSSELIYAEDKASGYKSRFPIVKVRNVIVMPGVPKQMQKALKMLDKRLFGEHRHVFMSDLYIKADEVTIATALNNTVCKHQTVTIGSYPHLMHSYYKTHLTLEGPDQDAVEGARQHFLAQLDPAVELGEYVTDSVDGAWPRLQRLLKREAALQRCVAQGLQVLQEALQQYRPEEICVCFNGGKDCLAVLHLFHALLHKEGVDHQHKLQAVYITEDNTFPKITQFVNQTIVRYDLDCSVLVGPLKAALSELQRHKPGIKAVIMGTRHTDPYSGSLAAFQPTDDDWPAFMRVSPILEWEYGEVWGFIRGLYLPYCSLYDRGYTSLGNASNTVQNPQLATLDRLGQPMYKPAYLLEDSKHERRGRT